MKLINEIFLITILFIGLSFGLGGIIMRGEYLLTELRKECFECECFTYCNETINQGNLTNQEFCNKLWVMEMNKK